MGKNKGGNRGGGGSSGGGANMKTVLAWVLGVATIALTLLIMLILFGNLSGNVGFTANSAEANLSDAFIANYTKGVANTGEQFPVVGTIIGVALLLLILIGVLVFAMVNLSKVNTGSTGSFG